MSFYLQPFHITNWLSKQDELWCKVLNIKQLYHEAFSNQFLNTIPTFDLDAFKKNPNHQFVYDKLFIAQSQDIQSGLLKDITLSGDIKYPIFIKPRWGHVTSSSKNCYKIKNPKELLPYLSKPHMMWSEFINANEGMTDFILDNGKIVYQLTYEYSPTQNVFADDWKYISSSTKPPEKIVQWVTKHMPNYTGVLNVQYRDDIIIEVSLRLARRGTYIKSTENAFLMNNINSLVGNPYKFQWKTDPQQSTDFKPFYSFKCWTPFCLFYILPFKIMEFIIHITGGKRFFEYYFEPTGSKGSVFFQFQHHNFKHGLKVKELIENLMVVCQVFFLLIGYIAICLITYKKTYNYGCMLLGIALLLYSTTFLNSYHHYSNVLPLRKY